MARDPEEKARFRGNDKAYAEGWDRIFGKKNSEQVQEDLEKSEEKEKEDE